MRRSETPDSVRGFAKAMRRAMPDAELRLWRRLKKPGIEDLRFRRQAPIGPYIADFFCPQRKLIVELDGEHHTLAERAERDLARDKWLTQRGYRVVRFANRDVFRGLEDVCEAIRLAAESA